MTQVDVGKVMEEIREEAKGKENMDPIPGLDDLPGAALRQMDWSVSCAYPAEGGNLLKRLYTKIVSKLVRCALFPMANRLTQVHEEMQLRMDELITRCEEQERRIEELEKGKK